MEDPITLKVNHPDAPLPMVLSINGEPSGRVTVSLSCHPNGALVKSSDYYANNDPESVGAARMAALDEMVSHFMKHPYKPELL